MSENTRSTSLQYMPVDVSGRLFAVPMSDVVTIQRVQVDASDTTNGASVSDSEPSQSQPVAQTIDLRYLFWGEALASRSPHAIVVTTSAGTCALLVDAVRASRVAEIDDVKRLPSIVSGTSRIFSGVVRNPDGLLLVIDIRRLVESVYQVAPELIMESSTHAA